MPRIAGRWYEPEDLPPHCSICKATDGDHEPTCRHFEPRREQYEPAPCAPSCELSDPDLAGRGAVCTCGNADRCEDCDGWGMTAHGPYDRVCGSCEGRGHA